MIKIKEWTIVLALALVTVLSLGLAPLDEHVPETPVEVVTINTATPTVRPTWTARPTATTTATPTATDLPETETPRPTATSTSSPTATLTPTATPFAFDVHAELDRFVYVDQAEQHMYVFERGLLVRDIPCSTGLPDGDKYTEAWSGPIGQYWGTFFAFDVYADEAWYLYKSAGSILVHSLPYTKENGYKVYQDREALGVHPASHGCVRIAPEDAVWFTAWNPEGVLCTVTDPYLDKWWFLRSTPTPTATAAP